MSWCTHVLADLGLKLALERVLVASRTNRLIATHGAQGDGGRGRGRKLRGPKCGTEKSGHGLRIFTGP